MGPSIVGAVLDDWSPGVREAVGVPAAEPVLFSFGVAQWTVPRRVLPGRARWIGWTAAGWPAGLAVFLGVAPLLWHAGQGVGHAARVGALAGVGMSATMAAVTGRGLVRLLRGPPFRQ